MDDARYHSKTDPKPACKHWVKQMRKRYCKVLLAVASVSLIGCGGKKAPSSPVAGQDEVSTYLETHGDQSTQETEEESRAVAP